MKILKNQIGPGLLSQFIWHKGENYIEPQRQGTPKGEPIGLSENKYWASLLMITNIKHREIARAVGVSYGLLRKWNTEEPFKRMVQSHCHDFALLFNEHIKERLRKRGKEVQGLLKRPIEKIAQADFPPVGYEEYSDARNYSLPLLSTIDEVFDSEIQPIWEKMEYLRLEDRANLWLIKSEQICVMDALRHFSGIPKTKDMVEWEERHERAELIFKIEVIKNTLLQPLITEEEKRAVIGVLTHIQRGLEIKQKKRESREQKKD